MASLRLDQFEGEDNSQTALSPKFGVVYQPVLDRVSLFANYMDGFNNVSPLQQGDPAAGATTTVTFDPERARQMEIGTKLNLVKNKVSASISYYDIHVSNIVMEETGRPFFYVQDGEQYSQGYEASVTVTPFAGLNIIAGYSHNDSKLTESDQTDFLGDVLNLQDLRTWPIYGPVTGYLQGLMKDLVLDSEEIMPVRI